MKHRQESFKWIQLRKQIMDDLIGEFLYHISFLVNEILIRAHKNLHVQQRLAKF